MTMNAIDGFEHIGLKPRQLQLIVALDDLRSISKVAHYVKITQPAVSKALAELERDLGLQLFERTNRGIIPTVYGECLVRHARIVLVEFMNSRDELRGLQFGVSGRINVGALSATAPSILPQALALLKQKSPVIHVQVQEGTMESLLPQLWLGKLDFIVGRLASHLSEGLAEQILAQESSLIVCAPAHRLSKRKKLGWSDLSGLPWVLPPAGTLLREPLEQAFESHHLAHPLDTIETLSVQITLSYVQCTHSLAVLPSSVARYYQELGLIHILPIELFKFKRPIGVLWNAQKPLIPSALQLIECLQQAVNLRQREFE